MLSYMDIFVRIASKHEDVTTAREQFLFKLYGAERFATQNTFSHVAYKRSVARTCNSFTLASTEWGWETGEHNLIVIVTNHRERFSRYGVR